MSSWRHSVPKLCRKRVYVAFQKIVLSPDVITDISPALSSSLAYMFNYRELPQLLREAEAHQNITVTKILYNTNLIQENGSISTFNLFPFAMVTDFYENKNWLIKFQQLCEIVLYL